MADALKEKQTDSWCRELNDGRFEIMCRTPGFRLRVAAPEDKAWEAVELFEEWTGLKIDAARRPRRVPAVPSGQMAMIELQSGGSGEEEESNGEH